MQDVLCAFQVDRILLVRCQADRGRRFGIMEIARPFPQVGRGAGDHIHSRPALRGNTGIAAGVQLADHDARRPDAGVRVQGIVGGAVGLVIFLPQEPLVQRGIERGAPAQAFLLGAAAASHPAAGIDRRLKAYRPAAQTLTVLAGGRSRGSAIAPGREMILQKSAFLASESGVQLSTYFRKNLGVGLFGGEGFIMQQLSGNGTAFVEIDGELIEYELKPGQQIVVDTGNVAGFSLGVQMEIQQVPGMKNKLLGGEGLFNTVLTGPGHVWLQTMPICNVAASIRPYIPIDNN